MSSPQLSDQIFRSLIPATCVSSRRLSTAKPILLPCPRPKSLKPKHLSQNSKWAIRLSLVEQSPPKSTFDMEWLVGFLYENMAHLFYDQGIDRTAYDERVKFRDPITKHDTIIGYVLNIAFLKIVFMPKFQLHWVKQDFWDSIKKNDYFSLEGLLDVFIQLRIYKTPYLETPKYGILKRTANYEVRRYAPYVVVEGSVDKLSGSAGFGDVTCLPDPNQETISLKKVEEGIAAVVKFSGKPTEDIVREKEKALRASLIRDGLKPK